MQSPAVLVFVLVLALVLYSNKNEKRNWCFIRVKNNSKYKYGTVCQNSGPISRRNQPLVEKRLYTGATLFLDH